MTSNLKTKIAPETKIITPNNTYYSINGITFPSTTGGLVYQLISGKRYRCWYNHTTPPYPQPGVQQDQIWQYVEFIYNKTINGQERLDLIHYYDTTMNAPTPTVICLELIPVTDYERTVRYQNPLSPYLYNICLWKLEEMDI